MSRILATGDIHGKATQRFAQYADKIHEEDTVVICGDFGIPFGLNNPFYEEETHKRQQNEAGWLDNQPWTTIALCGNHDDRDMIAEMPKVIINEPELKGAGRILTFNNKSYDNIIIIDEPCLWEIQGKTCLMIPGAACHDVDTQTGEGIIDPYKYENPDMDIWMKNLLKAIKDEQEKAAFNYNIHTVRLKGWSWWEDEDVDIPALEELIKENNLYNKHIDYIFSHEAPTEALFENPTGFYSLWRDRHLGATNETQGYLSDLYGNLDFDHWFTGHYHSDTTWLDNISTLYYDIINVDEEKRPIYYGWGVNYEHLA